MPVVNTLFFDLFNTLLSVGNVPERVGRFTADILGFDHDEWNAACFGAAHEICKPTVHLEVIRSLAHSLNPDIPHTLIELATQERQARFDYALLNIDVDVLETLAMLKDRSIRLCLISNASTAEVAAWPCSPLADLFDKAIFSCDCGMQKPDIAIFQHALQQLDADPKQSLFVGDGGSDEFVGAHAAGLATVLTRQFSKLSRLTHVKAKQGATIQHDITHIREVLELCG